MPLFTKRKRSRLGKFLDNEGRSQEWLIKKSKVSRGTISKCCSDPSYTPHLKTAQAIVNSLKKQGYGYVRLSDFFDV